MKAPGRPSSWPRPPLAAQKRSQDLCVLPCFVPHMNATSTPESRHYSPHFTDDKTEARVRSKLLERQSDDQNPSGVFPKLPPLSSPEVP